MEDAEAAKTSVIIIKAARSGKSKPIFIPRIVMLAVSRIREVRWGGKTQPKGVAHTRRRFERHRRALPHDSAAATIPARQVEERAQYGTVLHERTSAHLMNIARITKGEPF